MAHFNSYHAIREQLNYLPPKQTLTCGKFTGVQLPAGSGQSALPNLPGCGR